MSKYIRCNRCSRLVHIDDVRVYDKGNYCESCHPYDDYSVHEQSSIAKRYRKYMKERKKS